MNKAEVIIQVSQKSGITYDICEKVVNNIEKQMGLGDVLSLISKGNLKNATESVIQDTKNIMQDANITQSDCEKVLAAFYEVMGETLASKLKFWK